MLIKVRVLPGSKEESLFKKDGDTFEIKVKEKAENNLANNRVRELLALYFGIPSGRIKPIKGGKKRSKIYEIPG